MKKWDINIWNKLNIAEMILSIPEFHSTSDHMGWVYARICFTEVTGLDKLILFHTEAPLKSNDLK